MMVALVPTATIVVVVVSALASPPPPQNAPEWQKHVWWCTVDPGSSGSVFREAVKEGRSHFVAAQNCQTDAGNQRAVAEIKAAGEAAVNAYVLTLHP